MAMRAATMSQIDSPPVLRESDSALRKTVLLLLLMGASTLGIAILFEQATALPLLLTTFFTDVSLGLVAGFGSRFVLHRQELFFRSLAAILLTVLGMVIIGYITDWVLGVGPVMLDSKVLNQLQKISFERNLFEQVAALKIHWGMLLNFSKLDWADPIHMAISLLLAGLSLDAWRKAPAPADTVELAPLMTQAAAAPMQRHRRTASTSNGRARVQLPGNWLPRLRPATTPQPSRRRSNGRSRPPVATGAKIAKEPVLRPKRRRSRRKPKIQFAVVEEHRCPYCLDAVTHSDPRGVKECEVCHSLHHADCWAITGVCQVPHLNT
jgi:hypothetical protein